IRDARTLRRPRSLGPLLFGGTRVGVRAPAGRARSLGRNAYAIVSARSRDAKGQRARFVNRSFVWQSRTDRERIEDAPSSAATSRLYAVASRRARSRTRSRVHAARRWMPPRRELLRPHGSSTNEANDGDEDDCADRGDYD